MRIVITGPRSIGKSTISKIVAKKLGLEYISSDEIGEEALKEYGGLDKATKSGKIFEVIKKGGYTLILDVFKRDNFVFDLSGGSVSSTKLGEASKEVRETAKKYAIIVGLLPYKDKEESVKLLSEREGNREHFKHLSKEEVFEQTQKDFDKFPPLFRDFCNFIIYTENKTPERIADEILKKIKN